MPINFPFNNKIGYSGCLGQSEQNCNQDFSGCCHTPNGPVASKYINSNISRGVSFSAFTPKQKISLTKMMTNINLNKNVSTSSSNVKNDNQTISDDEIGVL